MALNVIISGDKVKDEMWGEIGLGNDLWVLLIFLFVDGITSFLPFGYLWKRYKRYRAEKTGDLTQKEANELFEGAEFLYANRISKYSKLLIITSFVISIFPLAPLVGGLYILFFYWIDKVFLLRLANIPKYCTVQLGNEMLRFLDVVLIAYAVVSTHSRRDS